MGSEAEEGDVGVGFVDEGFEGGVTANDEGGCGLVADVRRVVEGERCCG